VLGLDGNDFGGGAGELRQPLNFTLAHFERLSIIVEGNVFHVCYQGAAGGLLTVEVRLMSWRLSPLICLFVILLRLLLDINLKAHDLYLVLILLIFCILRAG
jgi:hypothetical protein